MVWRKFKKLFVHKKYKYSKTVAWLSPIHKEGNEQCFIYMIRYGCYFYINENTLNMANKSYDHKKKLSNQLMILPRLSLVFPAALALFSVLHSASQPLADIPPWGHWETVVEPVCESCLWCWCLGRVNPHDVWAKIDIYFSCQPENIMNTFNFKFSYGNFEE